MNKSRKSPLPGQPRKKGVSQISQKHRTKLVDGMHNKRHALEMLALRYSESYVSEVLSEFREVSRDELFSPTHDLRVVHVRYVLAALLHHVMLVAAHQEVAGEYCGMWSNSMNRALNQIDRAVRSPYMSPLKQNTLRICDRLRLPPEWLCKRK